MMFAFGEYRPDLPALDNPGVVQANNVRPVGNSYQPMPSAGVYSNALDTPNQGAYSTRAPSGAAYTYAGDSSRLYQLSSAVYSDVSRAAGYTTSAESQWHFVTYGNRVLATNGNDPIQVIALGTEGFEDLSPTAPKARDMDIVKNFLVVVNTQDNTDGSVPNRVRWPALADMTDWTVSSATQADFQDLEGSGGWNQRIIGGEYGVIFQEKSIWRMTYVGSPLVFQFDEVERGRGTPAPGSVVKVGRWIAYLGQDGFYIFDGQQSIPIGHQKIDQSFWADVDNNYLNKIMAVNDPQKKLIYWGYPSVQNTQGRIDKILVYQYAPHAKLRWSVIDGIDCQSLFLSLAEGKTLEDLDQINPNLDALAFSLDSRVWTEQGILLSGFDGENRQVNFDGSAMSAMIETGELNLFKGRRAQVTAVRPLVSGKATTLQIQIGVRNKLTELVAWKPPVSTNTSGYCPVRSNGRYHRARLWIEGEFTHAQGIEILQATPGGIR